MFEQGLLDVSNIYLNISYNLV